MPDLLPQLLSFGNFAGMHRYSQGLGQITVFSITDNGMAFVQHVTHNLAWSGDSFADCCHVCRVVQAQLEPTAAPNAAYNAQHYTDLMKHLQDVPMKDGNEWLAALMRKNQMLGARADLCQWGSKGSRKGMCHQMRPK